jgi:hypothetical protein
LVAVGRAAMPDCLPFWTGHHAANLHAIWRTGLFQIGGLTFPLAM